MKTANLDVRLQRTAESVRSHKTAHGDAITARDEVIGEAEDAGYGLSEIARKTGLYPSQVSVILAARTGRIQAGS